MNRIKKGLLESLAGFGHYFNALKTKHLEFSNFRKPVDLIHYHWDESKTEHQLKNRNLYLMIMGYQQNDRYNDFWSTLIILTMWPVLVKLAKKASHQYLPYSDTYSAAQWALLLSAWSLKKFDLQTNIAGRLKLDTLNKLSTWKNEQMEYHTYSFILINLSARFQPDNDDELNLYNPIPIIQQNINFKIDFTDEAIDPLLDKLLEDHIITEKDYQMFTSIRHKKLSLCDYTRLTGHSYKYLSRRKVRIEQLIREILIKKM